MAHFYAASEFTTDRACQLGKPRLFLYFTTCDRDRGTFDSASETLRKRRVCISSVQQEFCAEPLPVAGRDFAVSCEEFHC